MTTAPLPGRGLYERCKRGPVSTRDIGSADLQHLRQWLKPGEVFVMENFGRLMRITTGVHDVSLGQPTQPSNCPNCGAPRVAASRACDYCGSV